MQTDLYTKLKLQYTVFTTLNYEGITRHTTGTNFHEAEDEKEKGQKSNSLHLHHATCRHSVSERLATQSTNAEHTGSK